MIRALVTGRRTGKTSSLIENLRWNENAVLLVHDRSEQKRLEDQYSWARGRILSYRDTEKIRGLHNAEIYIDNLDLFLYSHFGTGVRGFTMTGSKVRGHDLPNRSGHFTYENASIHFYPEGFAGKTEK